MYDEPNDEEHLYLIVINHHAMESPIWWSPLDVISPLEKMKLPAFMDPFDDRRNGFSFGQNAAGRQMGWYAMFQWGAAWNLSLGLINGPPKSPTTEDKWNL